jgi:hypothetical protein
MSCLTMLIPRRFSVEWNISTYYLSMRLLTAPSTSMD